MPFSVRRADYFYAMLSDEPGEAYRFLSQLEEIGTNLLAFAAVPAGPMRTQITLFPEDVRRLQNDAIRAGITLDGPNPALLVRGDDELGALAGIHEQLFKAGVNVVASSGVSDGSGGYAYVIYVRPSEYEQAAGALGV
jgi:hypothetical protein